MLSSILQLKLATMTMAGWMAATSPVPLPTNMVALALEGQAASPVEVKLYDENRRVSTTVILERNGDSDLETAKQLRHAFRCISTNREASIAKGTLAMLADIAERYQPRPVEFVSVYRVKASESLTSPHRDARAIDFRIRGVPLREVRDYLWRKYSHVGIGWYPSEQFLHMDSRPTMNDTAWTFLSGVNHYHPYWAEVARRPAPGKTVQARRPGS